MASNQQNTNKHKKGMNSKIHRFFRIIPEHGHFIIPKSFTSKYGDVIPNPLHVKTPDGREWNIKWIIQHEELEKAENPSFTMVMKSTYLNQYMHVKKAFAKEYLKEERSVILQLSDGRSWPCKYIQGRINDGWTKFVSHNKLKVGDTCVFELIDDSQNLTFKVDIKPFVDVNTKSPPQGKKEFASKNPFFSYKMGSSHRPCVPISFNRKHLDKKNQLVKLKVGKKIWEVQLLCENPSSEASSRLSKGWAKFVNDNELERGDECVFEHITKKPVALFDVHIFRCA